MKRLLKSVLLAILLLVPFGVYAHEFGHVTSKELINSTENDNETITYEYAFNVYSDAGEYVSDLIFNITYNTSFYSPSFVTDSFTIQNSGPVVDPEVEGTVYSYELVARDGDFRIYGGRENTIGVFTITLPNDVDPEEAFDWEIREGAGHDVYMDENNYNLTVSDVNDLGEYTIELLVGSLVFDFNENFDGTFTWEAHGESGIKINNLSSKGIRVAFDFNSNINELTLGGRMLIRQAATTKRDCLGYYAVTAQDHSNYPDDWKTNVYDNTGLFARTYFTDDACTVPLENGAEYDETKEYYFVDNFDGRGFPEDFRVEGYIFDVDAYDQAEYVYPGLDFDFELEGGTLEDVQRVQRGNKKIGTITVTIVGV